MAYHHLWIRDDGSQITDLWEDVIDHKLHKCAKCRIEKPVKTFVIYGSKYNPKLSKVCKFGNNYCRK